MFLFGLGKLVYVIVLIINAIAVLSEDRFLARIGWGRTQAEPGFGASYDSTSVKAKSVNLIASVRTVMRSKWSLPLGNPQSPIYNTVLGSLFLAREYASHATPDVEDSRQNRAGSTVIADTS
ncbi:Protein transport protein YOS1 [Penicillium subrubescens]|uniref:Protein transport protein YOS1 n=1 Tax=Penicillium subrubescens TaxID=1316194 RepID=A0A1Q5SXI1_9EURO|nr:Protein transport protein YOS1 [Penicillium subrubescens]